MAKDVAWTKKAGVTPGKLVLIGVLAVVLVAVLYHQLAPLMTTASSGTASSAPAARAPVRESKSRLATVPKTAPAEAAPLKKTGAVASWQTADLASAVNYDPFALPASFPKPQPASSEAALVENSASDAQAKAEAAAAQQAALAAERSKSESELQGLKQPGVLMFIENGDKAVAMVRDKAVRVGDKIDGFTVMAIDADGVVTLAKDLNP